MTKTLQELLAIGIKAEMEAIEAYSKLAENIDNLLLQERFSTLSKDENRHKIILEQIYEESFPGQPLSLPAQSGVPKVHPIITQENSITDILSIAMDAEKKAEDYYHDLASQMDNQLNKDLLNYLAKIESGHYYFLKLEYDRSKNESLETK